MSRLLILLGLCTVARLCLGVDPGERVAAVPLITLDGRSLNLTNYAERRGTAIVFLSARGVMAPSEVERLKKLSSRFRTRGILFAGVFSHPEESAAEVRRFAQHSGFLFPVYRDPEHKAAQRLGATVTPEVFLLDSAGVVVYRGGIDDSREAGLEPALSALLKGEPVDVSPAPSTGTSLTDRLPPRETPDPYGSVAFSSELIFEKIPDAPAHHCSTITQAANGDLLVAWYGGSYESSDDQALFLSRRKRGRRTWTTPEVLIHNSAQPPGNAVVFRDPADRTWIVWCRMEASRPLRRGGGWGQTCLFYRTSKDHGVTWSKDSPFLGGLMEGLRNVPTTLADGELLLPLGRSFARSRDHGRSWEHLGSVSGGGQPTVIRRSDGSLLTLLRKGPHIMQTESVDGGRTWTPPSATTLPNPDAGIAMTRLTNGHLVLVFNNSENSRTPLSLTRSLDEGRTWETPLNLESNPGEYSYPCVIHTADGRIHITYTFRRYTIKHVEMDENWIIRLDRPN